MHCSAAAATLAADVDAVSSPYQCCRTAALQQEASTGGLDALLDPRFGLDAREPRAAKRQLDTPGTSIATGGWPPAPDHSKLVCWSN